MLSTFFPGFPIHTDSVRIFMADKTSHYLKTVLRIAAYRIELEHNRHTHTHTQAICNNEQILCMCESVHVSFFLFFSLLLSLALSPRNVFMGKCCICMMRTWFHFISFENMEMPYKFIRQWWRFV